MEEAEEDFQRFSREQHGIKSRNETQAVVVARAQYLDTVLSRYCTILSVHICCNAEILRIAVESNLD